MKKWIVSMAAAIFLSATVLGCAGCASQPESKSKTSKSQETGNPEKKREGSGYFLDK